MLLGRAHWVVIDPEIDFGELFKSFDTILMGRRTFEAAAASGGGGAMPGVRTVVVSTTMRPEDHPKITVVGDRVEEMAARLRAEPGKDIWLFGGGALFRSLLDARLVDAVEVAVIPVLLGGGTPLLPPTAHRVKLRLIGSRVYEKSGIVSLEYAVEPSGQSRRAVRRR